MVTERAGQELSAEARQLIANARGADDPTAEDESRVKARWLAGIAAGAGVSSLSEAVRAAASTGWTWGMKSALVLGAAAVAAVGVYLGWPESDSQRAAPEQAPRGAAAPAIAPSPGAPEAPVAEAPISKLVAPQAAQGAPPTPPGEAAPELPALEVTSPAPEAIAPAEAPLANEVQAEPPATTPPAARPARAARPRYAAKASASRKAAATLEPAPEQPAKAAAAGQLGEEIERISAIRGHLQSGSAARALELLSEYRLRFAEPNLAMEADALQVDALCKVGQRGAAREAAAAFSRRWPASPLEQRVSGACPQ